MTWQGVDLIGRVIECIKFRERKYDRVLLYSCAGFSKYLIFLYMVGFQLVRQGWQGIALYK